MADITMAATRRLTSYARPTLSASSGSPSANRTTTVKVVWS